MGEITEKTLCALAHEDQRKTISKNKNLIGYVEYQQERTLVRFGVEYKTNGRRYRYYIGTWPKLSVKEIQQEAQWVNGLIRDGINPTLAKKAYRSHKKNEVRGWIDDLARNRHENLTVLSLFNAWIADGVNRKNDNYELRRVFNKDVLPVIGKVPVRQLSEIDVLKVLRKQQRRGVVKLVLTTLSDMKQMFSWAEKRQPWRQLLIDGNPVLQINKKTLTPTGYRSERNRVLSEYEIYELGQIFKKCDQEYPEGSDGKFVHRPIAKRTELALWICFGTLCRIGELLKSRWEHVDLREGIWFIPRSSTKGQRQEHVVFMSAFIRQKFIELHALSGHTPWCFPARNHLPNKMHVCVKSVTKQVADRQVIFKNRTKALEARAENNMLVLASGVHGAWTPHDLRRTGATMMQAMGISLEVIDRCQNHVLNGSRVRRHYLHHDYALETAEAWCRLGEKISSILVDPPQTSARKRAVLVHPLRDPQWSTWGRENTAVM